MRALRKIVNQLESREILSRIKRTVLDAIPATSSNINIQLRNNAAGCSIVSCASART